MAGGCISGLPRRACGIVRRGSRILLQRKISDTVWALPGGKVEPGETAEVALRREFDEELGWRIGIVRMLWEFENVFTHAGVDERQMEVCFEVTCGEELNVRDETLEFRWVSAAELAAIDVRPAAYRTLIFRSS